MTFSFGLQLRLKGAIIKVIGVGGGSVLLLTV